ncbi:MAG: glycosyltransferase family 4 protein [Candidatus Moranbacteria bacterium]|jgi:glycosyltransferase involved in cell wall biosynthesis|nr:glycosyltransferase family 4 protein [Candidatus Moranbacteria bacterium]MBP9801814.1 glycosyltransferase family 4 protein [Candidatus Moranbacteria bacterium]
MKIAFIGQKSLLTHAGSIEKHVKQLAVSMALLGNEVTVYVREKNFESPKEVSGISLVALPGIRVKRLETISHIALATIHALFQHYDIIHFHSIGPSVFSLLPRIFRPDMRVVATFHSRDYLHHHRNYLSRLFLKFAEFITCTVPEKTIVVSKTLAQYTKDVYQKSFILIPSGIDVSPTEKTTLLKKYGLKENRYILSVSRLARHKGIHYLIKAFQALKETSELPGNSWKLIIVSTQNEVKEYVSYLRFLAAGDTDIIFIDTYTENELAQLHSHAGTFVNLAEDEDLSSTLLEALGYGLPCIVSDTPANREAVADCGVICESKNILDLKQKLSSLINRPDTMKIFSTLSKERAQSEYDWHAIAKRTVSLYETLLAQKPSIWKASFAMKKK